MSIFNIFDIINDAVGQHPGGDRANSSLLSSYRRAGKDGQGRTVWLFLGMEDQDNYWWVESYQHQQDLVQAFHGRESSEQEGKGWVEKEKMGFIREFQDFKTKMSPIDGSKKMKAIQLIYWCISQMTLYLHWIVLTMIEEHWYSEFRLYPAQFIYIFEWFKTFFIA